MGFYGRLSMEPGFVSSAPIGTPAFPSGDFSDKEAGVFTDVGDTRPISSFDTVTSTFTGYDYGNKSYDTTEQMLNDENLPQSRPQSATTYEALRRQNREEYESKIQSQGPLGGGGFGG
jgi:hypothetical protein